MTDTTIFIQKAFDFAKQCHALDNGGHDFSHIKRVYENVCLLLQETNSADPLLLKWRLYCMM